MEDILAAARAAGASSAGYVLLRLPHEVAPLFREWLAAHHPDRAKRVMSLIAETRGGKDYDSRFGIRMQGTGPYADLLRARFELASRKLGFDAGRTRHDLATHLFRPPRSTPPQLSLDLE
jgi:DNA repair photolyase